MIFKVIIIYSNPLFSTLTRKAIHSLIERDNNKFTKRKKEKERERKMMGVGELPKPVISVYC